VCGFYELGVLPLAEVVGLQWLAERVPPARKVAPLLREYQAVVVVVLTVRQLQLGLVAAMAAEERDRLGCDLHRARRLVLQRAEHR
jgi:hypothetical protein